MGLRLLLLMLVLCTMLAVFTGDGGVVSARHLVMASFFAWCCSVSGITCLFLQPLPRRLQVSPMMVEPQMPTKGSLLSVPLGTVLGLTARAAPCRSGSALSLGAALGWGG